MKRITFRSLQVVLLLCMLCSTFGIHAAAAETTVKIYTASEEDQGWKKQGSNYVYLLSNGKKLTGWLKKGTKVFYLNKKGVRVSGWTKISGKYYYFSTAGVRKTKWLKVGTNKYYLDPSANGARVTGMKKIGKSTYYFNKKGVMKTGWVKYKGKYYYFKTSGKRASGWVTVNGKKYYMDPTTGVRVTGTVTIKGTDYIFSSKGVLETKVPKHSGNWYGTDGKLLYNSTIKNLLQTALKPVGSTMYVWGGGWNLSQSGGDITARTIGVSSTWKAFYKKQTSSYDYTKTRYQVKNGLDCSGFVGWTIYNTFNKVSGHAGYVMLAQQQARVFASYGWGSYKTAASVTDFKAGDIMSTSEGHVYIVIGQCSDGSVVLVHSSPQGVMISGTASKTGKANSKAVKLAKKYMKKYYPEWYKKFPKVARGISYIKNYNQMRWYLTSGSIMTDPDNYTGKSAEKVLADLFA